MLYSILIYLFILRSAIPTIRKFQNYPDLSMQQPPTRPPATYMNNHVNCGGLARIRGLAHTRIWRRGRRLSWRELATGETGRRFSFRWSFIAMLPQHWICTAWAITVGACITATHAVPMHATWHEADETHIAPLVQSTSAASVPDNYMVVLKPEVTTEQFVKHREHVAYASVLFSLLHDKSAMSGVDFARIMQTQENGIASHWPAQEDVGLFRHIFDMGPHLQGYAGRMDASFVDALRRLPEVDYVERDSIVDVTMLKQDDRSVQDMPLDSSVPASTFPWDSPYQHLTEDGAPWGLARISHRKSLSLGTFNKYVYESIGGEGVTAYVIDTGVNIAHKDFEGRASWGKTLPLNDTDIDDHGHGTHVAGTIASKTFGVAKKADIIAVKVLGSGGQGTMSDVTAGVLWAVADAQNKTREIMNNPNSAAARKHRGFVANMSLGGSKSPTLDRAVRGAVKAGMHFGVAAGNEAQDACFVSPASVETAVTVGASTIADEQAFFSNTGPCVDIFAPGLNILSTWSSSPRSINTLSGTSMASPHIVGLMAYLLSIYGTDDFMLIKDAVPTRVAPAAMHQADTHGLRETGRGHGEMSARRRLLQVLQKLMPSWMPSLERLFPQVPVLSTEIEQGLSIESALRPADLKKAMRRMAISNALEHLDPETTNKLAYNNATTTNIQ